MNSTIRYPRSSIFGPFLHHTMLDDKNNPVSIAVREDECIVSNTRALKPATIRLIDEFHSCLVSCFRLYETLIYTRVFESDKTINMQEKVSETCEFL